jgi:hypothetical protein
MDKEIEVFQKRWDELQEELKELMPKVEKRLVYGASSDSEDDDQNGS